MNMTPAAPASVLKQYEADLRALGAVKFDAQTTSPTLTITFKKGMDKMLADGILSQSIDGVQLLTNSMTPPPHLFAALTKDDYANNMARLPNVDAARVVMGTFSPGIFVNAHDSESGHHLDQLLADSVTDRGGAKVPVVITNPR